MNLCCAPVRSHSQSLLVFHLKRYICKFKRGRHLCTVAQHRVASHVLLIILSGASIDVALGYPSAESDSVPSQSGHAPSQGMLPPAHNDRSARVAHREPATFARNLYQHGVFAPSPYQVRHAAVVQGLGTCRTSTCSSSKISSGTRCRL